MPLPRIFKGYFNSKKPYFYSHCVPSEETLVSKALANGNYFRMGYNVDIFSVTEMQHIEAV